MFAGRLSPLGDPSVVRAHGRRNSPTLHSNHLGGPSALARHRGSHRDSRHHVLRHHANAPTRGRRLVESQWPGPGQGRDHGMVESALAHSELAADRGSRSRDAPPVARNANDELARASDKRVDCPLANSPLVPGCLRCPPVWCGVRPRALLWPCPLPTSSTGLIAWPYCALPRTGIVK